MYASVGRGVETPTLNEIAYRPDGGPNWSVASGKFIQGLHNRRIDEMKLCLTP